MTDRVRWKHAMSIAAFCGHAELGQWVMRGRGASPACPQLGSTYSGPRLLPRYDACALSRCAGGGGQDMTTRHVYVRL